MQTTVNCFMDSNKDPKGMYGRDVSPGVRQVRVMESKATLSSEVVMAGKDVT